MKKATRLTVIALTLVTCSGLGWHLLPIEAKENHISFFQSGKKSPVKAEDQSSDAKINVQTSSALEANKADIIEDVKASDSTDATATETRQIMIERLELDPKALDAYTDEQIMESRKAAEEIGSDIGYSYRYLLEHYGKSL